jgi:hypothetical protein
LCPPFLHISQNIGDQVNQVIILSGLYTLPLDGQPKSPKLAGVKDARDVLFFSLLAILHNIKHI